MSAWRQAHDRLPAIRVQAQFLPSQVVVQIHARRLARLNAALFPSGLQGEHVVLVQDRPALATVLVDRAQVGADLARQRRVNAPLCKVVEKGEQLVELLLRDGVVLVVVALRAADGKAQPDRAEGAGPVHCFLEGILGAVHAALSIAQRVAVEPGGDALLDRRAGQQVPGELLDREAVKSHACIERVDDPAPVAPGMRPDIVLGIAVQVGVAHLIQPVEGLLLAEVLRRQQALHHPLVRPLSRVLAAGGLLFPGGRDPGQVQRHAGQQRVPLGTRRRLASFRPQALAHEMIDWIASCRHSGPDNGLEGPMSRLARGGSGRSRAGRVRPRRSLVDPSAQPADLGRAERFPGRGHDRLDPVARHELDQAALGRVARNDCRPRVAA